MSSEELRPASRLGMEASGNSLVPNTLSRRVVLRDLVLVLRGLVPEDVELGKGVSVMEKNSRLPVEVLAVEVLVREDVRLADLVSMGTSETGNTSRLDISLGRVSDNGKI